MSKRKPMVWRTKVVPVNYAEEREIALRMGRIEEYRTRDGRLIYLFRTSNKGKQQFCVDIPGDLEHEPERWWHDKLVIADLRIVELREPGTEELASYAVAMNRLKP